MSVAASTGGENYGWNRREGLISHLDGALLAGDVEPMYDYSHGGGQFQGKSIVGGYRYRGPDPSLQGLYFFADTISTNFWIFDPADPFGTVQNINASLTPDMSSIEVPVSFGEDLLGNLYIVEHTGAGDGEVFQMVTEIPEPSTLMLALTALAALLVTRVRRDLVRFS